MSEKSGASKSARRVRTGEKRKSNQPLKIDRLPSEILEKILYLRNSQGKTWLEIESMSAEPCPTNENKTALGFIDWPALPFAILELFPDMRLPHSSLHRWYDIRVAQVQRDVMLRSKQAQQIAKAFAKSNVADGDEAVINAARDTLMSVLSEDGTAAGRLNATRGLLKLSEVMSKVRTNTIRARAVSVQERQIAQLEKDAELKRAKFQSEMDAAEKKVTKGEPLTIADINDIRMKVFGIGPAPVPANG